MANRMFFNEWYSLTRRVVDLFGKFTTTTSGAIATTAGTNSAPGQGILSVARTAAGRYLITLQDSYNAFLGLGANIAVTGTSALTGGKASTYIVRAEAVASTPPVVTLQFLNTVTDADVEDGALVKYWIRLRDTPMTNS